MCQNSKKWRIVFVGKIAATYLPAFLGDIVDVEFSVARSPAVGSCVVRIEQFRIRIDEFVAASGDDIVVQIAVQMADPGSKEFVKFVHPAMFGENVDSLRYDQPTELRITEIWSSLQALKVRLESRRY